jgi:hypothetical protein
LGWSGERPIHAVAADDPESDITVVITAYQPAPQLWAPTLVTNGVPALARPHCGEDDVNEGTARRIAAAAVVNQAVRVEVRQDAA